MLSWALTTLRTPFSPTPTPPPSTSTSSTAPMSSSPPISSKSLEDHTRRDIEIHRTWRGDMPPSPEERTAQQASDTRDVEGAGYMRGGRDAVRDDDEWEKRERVDEERERGEEEQGVKKMEGGVGSQKIGGSREESKVVTERSKL